MTECRKPVLKKYAALFLTLALFTSFVACSNLDIKPPEPDQKPVSVLTGKSGGTKLSDLFGQKKDTSNMPVNAFLWRAALDIAKFVPLDDIDTFGGSIVTEWYQSGSQQDQRLKLAFFVSGLELRSDAIIVQTYIQQRAGDSWIDIGSDNQLARRLEDLVLTRARELRAVSLGETTQ